jgi:hypothetical protein
MSEEGGRVLTDEERAQAMREQLKSLHTFDLAYEMMVSLVSFGYQKLGLTGETAELRDLDDAHYTIELLGAILNVSDREHPVSDLRDLHSTLAQMQLGYVQALEMEGRRPPEPPSEAEAAAAHEATPEEVERDLEANMEAAQPAGDEALRADEASPAAPPLKKPAAKRPAAKRPAAKKPAARKTAAKKPATKKPATGRKKPAPEPGEG